MSVLIKGFVMPTKREECPFCDYEEGACTAWLNVKDDDEIRYCIQGVHPPKDRPEWCPLVEIPDHAVIWGTKSDGVPVVMLLQAENKERKDERAD